ncbi:meiotically up-regulated protein [Rhizoctonia solani]|uniref:Meiotically up-regulated protein n=1 Tax=Rhizoctonia solani TaxID=456999 RepID=A0A8H8NV57_9AGAM|nr:meiotically up-regulated protein [Rhizoctonia solani]QRW19428.1 meiotically up-regulated protein [Rhizoctonia solani]
MDIYTTSFTHPRTGPSASYSPASSIDFTPELRTPQTAYSPVRRPVRASSHVAEIMPDAVQAVCIDAMQQHGCLVTYTRADDARAWNFHLSGAYAQVMAARGHIIRECPVQVRAAIKVARHEILDSPTSSPALKADVRRRLDDIAGQTLAHIAVVNASATLNSVPVPDGINSQAWSGLEPERMCELVVTGTREAVAVARLRLLVMIDELSGLHADSCDIDHKLHPIIAGRKRSVIQTIQEETATNIYFPSALVGLNVHMVPSAGPAKSHLNTIWITGEFFGVQRAKDMLVQVAALKGKSLISRDTAVLPRKLDWMLLERLDELKSIMADNGTFINLPPVGSQASLVSVFGDHRVNIQRTCRAVMQLACQFYVASFWLLPVHYNVLMPVATLNPASMPGVLKRIAGQSGAEVVFKSNCFEMHGLEHEIELANEHRDFISGKKNGKINKIMQMANVKIKFETFNEFNFLMDLSGNDASVISGLVLLQEELPAEISFHVPETYHKRIIGVGGRSIQRIMKKYGVYVKFSNAEEFAALGGYGDNEDNVIARTPAKNAINLDNLKQADKDYVIETVSIPRRYHRTLLGEKSIFIKDIETKTNSKVRFPDKESASDAVAIFGPESQVHVASAMLLDHVPFEADMVVPPHSELASIVQSTDYLSFSETCKRDYQVVIVPQIPASGSGERPSFKFRCQRSNSDFLATAREQLEAFLVSAGIEVYPSTMGKRADSYITDAFPHFGSKLLSTTAPTASAASTVSASSDLVEFPRTGDGYERRIRLASSTPDVKALFNNPSYVYNLPEHDEADDIGFGRNFTVSGPPLTADMWSPPMNYRPGFSLTHSRAMEDSVKRGSDSLLESKLKERISKPRSLQNSGGDSDSGISHAQGPKSGPHFAHFGRAPGILDPYDQRTIRSASPTDYSTTPSSPTSATIPSFPSVNGPAPVNGNNINGLPKVLPRQTMPPGGTDEITRAMASVRFDSMH